VTWSLGEINPSNPILEVRYSGVLDQHELTEAFTAATELAQQSNVWRILADCTDLQGGHSVINLYEIVSKLAALEGSRSLREALVRPANSQVAELVSFYETTSLNRGMTMRTFDDRESAIEWLLQ